MNEDKGVVVIGGGFAGVAATLQLRKKLKGKVKLTLIDRNPYHLFTPSLYEVATSEEPQKNIAIPFDVILSKGVQILQNEVIGIDTKTKQISMQDGLVIGYDYLLIAGGSEPAFMGITGLQEKSIGFKTLRDALLIKDKIKNMCCEEGKCNRKVQVVIGGGGFAGTELAAELLTYKDKIAKQNNLDRECLDLTIIQGGDKLLKELSEHVSVLAQKRLNYPNVHLAFGGHIKEVTDKEVLTDDGKSYPYQILIWTGGVKPNHLATQSNLPVNDHGGILVDNFLQVQGVENVFAVGDIAGYVDPVTKEHAHTVAQVAEEQGHAAGENIARLIQNKKMEEYKYRHWGYVVPLKGYFAVAELTGFHLDGFFGWILQQLVFLRYLLGILPVWKAFTRFNKFEMEMKK